MPSRDRSKDLDLERDLPTTPQDVAALRRAAALGCRDFDEYLLFLAQLPPLSPDDLRRRRIPRGDPPFELDPGQ
jgi:hypothetical protein